MSVFCKITSIVVVRRIHESGIKDSNHFAGEREDSNPKTKDSNFCCQVKSTQNCSKLSKIGHFLANLCANNYQAKIYEIWTVLILILIEELAPNVILWALFNGLCTISK
jgi:hypothetical protein